MSLSRRDERLNSRVVNHQGEPFRGLTSREALRNKLYEYAMETKHVPPSTAPLRFDHIIEAPINDRTRFNETLLQRYTDTIALMKELDAGGDEGVIENKLKELKKQHRVQMFGQQPYAQSEYIRAFNNAYKPQ